jgi:hypothetical protein
MTILGVEIAESELSWMAEVRFPAGATDFSLLHNFHTGFNPMNTGELSKG